MNKIQQTATVLWNQPAGPACFRLGLSCARGYEKAVPGQFVMVQTSQTYFPLLRRPFSIFGVIGPAGRPEGIELLIKTLGRGTAQLSRLAPGDTIDLLGPLGRGFSSRPVRHRQSLSGCRRIRRGADPFSRGSSRFGRH